MFPRLSPVILFTLFFLLANPIRAELVADIYSMRMAVEDRRASTLADARRDGLRGVLVKASGVADPGAEEVVQQALTRADRYLRSYSYEEDDGLWLVLEFDERAVRSLMEEAGLPLWTANRPRILTWLVINDREGRRFVSAAEAPEAFAAMRGSFDGRGLPLQTPLLDLEDAAAISPGEAWRQSSDALVRASRRYGDVELLAGRVAMLSDGSWMGDWQLLDGGRWIVRPVNVPSLEAFTDQGADLATGVFAARYAVTLQAADKRHRVTLRGIRGFADYLAAQQALAGLEAVRRVVPEHLVGDQVSLRIEADADLVQLARIIELDERFVAAPTTPLESGLYYEFVQ